MFRLFIALVGALLVLGGTPVHVLAQEAAGTTILGSSGDELAVVTVEEVVDPFDNYDPAYPPIRGYHYLLLSLAVENTGSRPIQVDPSDLLLRDTDGFLYGDGTVYREEDAAGPDLENQELAAGATASGVVGFQVLNGVELAGLWLVLDNGQLVHLQQFGGTPSGVGDDVVVVGNDGAEIGTVTVSELIDPYEDYPDNDPPDRGSHYVVLEVAFVNSGPRPMEIDPNDVLLQDTDGFLYAAQSLSAAEGATPELTFGELATGDEIGGTIAFGVINGVDIARVLYQPANDRLMVLVDLTEADEGLSVGTSGDDSTPEATDDDPATTGSTGDVDCDEIGDWLAPVYRDSSSVMGVMGVVLTMQVDEDPEFVETAHQVAQAFLFTADGLRSLTAPDAVADLNGDLAAAYEAFGEALEAYATATEEGDQAAIDEAGQAWFDAEPAVITAVQAVEALAQECGIATEE